MQIVDIVNKEVLTIENCESEPIHIPGSIQPHGWLLAIEPQGGAIRYCSANTAVYSGLAPEQLLGKTLPAIAPALWEAAKAAPQHPPFQPVKATFNDKPFLVFTDVQPGITVLAIEPDVAEATDGLLLFDQTMAFVSSIERARSLQDLCQHIAAETRRITGYDRVMIYRFDKAYNGEVYAESTADGVAPFLGLQYPHTDIPPQARELYLRNLLRMIPDVHYTPVPLLTTADRQNSQLNLGDTGLRSVSPIHIQYLKNMEVAATLTISIIMEDKLWGLIACHHHQPLLLTFQQRKAALLQGHFLSSQIRVRQVAEEHEVNVTVEAHLQQLLNKIDTDEDFQEQFGQLTSLLAVTNATGVAVLHEGQLYEKGLVPSRDKILALVRWAGDNLKSPMFSTHCLSKRYPEAAAMAQYSSGIIFHALGKPTESCIIWFREELQRTIRWGGRPDTAVRPDVQTKALTPRRSFEIWKEQVKNYSAEWRVSELNAAIRFATTLQNHFHMGYLRNEESRLRLLNQKLQQANQELSNINWITSHDLKEPLRKIQLFASRIMYSEGEELSALIKGQIEKIQHSANRMQHLVDDILSYSMTSQRGNLFVLTNLQTIVDTVQADLHEEITEHRVHIHQETLPHSIRVVPHQMNQLFTNLISNSIKFAQEGQPMEISITSRLVKGRDVTEVALPAQLNFYCITLADNGIGFAPKFSEKIFDVFYRLHSGNTYKGTGIGLAICKKIMETHKGAITAHGEEGKGAAFKIYLPA